MTGVYRVKGVEHKHNTHPPRTHHTHTDTHTHKHTHVFIIHTTCMLSFCVLFFPCLQLKAVAAPASSGEQINSDFISNSPKHSSPGRLLDYSTMREPAERRPGGGRQPRDVIRLTTTLAHTPRHPSVSLFLRARKEPRTSKGHKSGSYSPPHPLSSCQVAAPLF